MSEENETVREAFMRDRTAYFKANSTPMLMERAKRYGLAFSGNTPKEDLARWVAGSEWEREHGSTKDYPPTDVTGIPFEEPDGQFEEPLTAEKVRELKEEVRSSLFGEFQLGPDRVMVVDFENMDSGPMNLEEPDPAVADLKRQIMSRWIGAIGGLDWYNGPIGEEQAQPAGKALAAVLDDVLHGGVVRGSNPYGAKSTSGWFIYEVVLPDVLRRFFRKNADYGDNHRTGLGLKAEFVGLHRKIEKLKKAIWEDQFMQGEGADEMLEDLIGQCLIMLDLIMSEDGTREE